jgi:hypothetical protein
MDDSVLIDTLDESKFTENVLKSSKYVELSDVRNTELRSNTDSTIRVSDNETAAQILNDGFLDLSREDVKVDSLNTEEMATLTNLNAGLSVTDQEKLKLVKQATAGKVDVLPSNSVSIEDIDIDEIPEDQDVILSPEKKQVLLIGKPR